MPRTLSVATRTLNSAVSPKPRHWSPSIWRALPPQRRGRYLSSHPSPDGSLLGQGCCARLAALVGATVSAQGRLRPFPLVRASRPPWRLTDHARATESVVAPGQG